MAIVNIKKREITSKIVYYGPGYGGKTTNIQAIHQTIPDQKRSELKTIDTEGDRTLFFEQFTVSLGDCGGMSLRFLVFGVPGQSYYQSTRKIVLQGCDGIVFVADSDAERMSDNEESLRDMKQLLTEHNIDSVTLPLVLQYNKRDLKWAMPLEQMEEKLNERGVPSIEAVAIECRGVQETFKTICNLVGERIQRDFFARA